MPQTCCGYVLQPLSGLRAYFSMSWRRLRESQKNGLSQRDGDTGWQGPYRLGTYRRVRCADHLCGLHVGYGHKLPCWMPVNSTNSQLLSDHKRQITCNSRQFLVRTQAGNELIAGENQQSMGVGQMLCGYHINGPHRSCEFFELTWNSAQYVAAEMLRGYHRNGPHSGPYTLLAWVTWMECAGIQRWGCASVLLGSGGIRRSFDRPGSCGGRSGCERGTFR